MNTYVWYDSLCQVVVIGAENYTEESSISLFEAPFTAFVPSHTRCRSVASCELQCILAYISLFLWHFCFTLYAWESMLVDSHTFDQTQEALSNRSTAMFVLIRNVSWDEMVRAKSSQICTLSNKVCSKSHWPNFLNKKIVWSLWLYISIHYTRCRCSWIFYLFLRLEKISKIKWKLNNHIEMNSV